MTPIERALAYHDRTKHHLNQYARALGYLDWDTQPDPFRTFEGAPRVRLPLRADRLASTYRDLYTPSAIPPSSVELDSVATLFELALGLSAWKRYKTSRWALARLARAKPVLTGDAMAIERDGAITWVRFIPSRAHARTARLRGDFELAFLLGFGRLMVDPALVPVELRVRGPAPAHAALYRLRFGCPVSFGAEHDALGLQSADLRRPLLGGAPELAETLRRRVDDRVEEMGHGAAEPQVAAILRGRLEGTPPTLAQTARLLATSARSLQRKLAAAGTRFVDVLDRVRREVACEELASSPIALADLAYRVGFANPNAFHRAFKRWTGLTPEQYRDEAQAEGAAEVRGVRPALREVPERRRAVSTGSDFATTKASE